MFSASDVKELREKTGAGMMDCKKALTATEGDMEKAFDWLRENGIAKAEKKSSRIAAEGTTSMVVNGNQAVILEVNSETDFVAKNPEFQSFVQELTTIIVENDVNTMDDAMNLSVNGVTVADMIANVTAKIGEKISFRRFEKVTKTDSQVFGSYSHMGGKIGVIVLLEGANEEVSKDVAMHVAAMRPSYLNSSEVPEDVLNREKEVMREQLLNEGKPADKVDGILVGKVNKYYQDVCLEDQIFIKAENKESVGKFVANNNGKILGMIRYEVGEGIEKRQENFAEEVMSQING
ncbi:MAG: elongation factor Ts [Firmicutes bacterium]|nr:elongation factor Ts [Bacillota bacterium]